MITAIPTSHNGIKFRSRLEARWAMFFDLMRTDYLYESEGYQLESGWYVPDFWLPQIKSFVEIKPLFNLEYERERTASYRAQNLCSDLAKETGHRVYMMCGDFGNWLPFWEERGEEGDAFFPGGDCDYGYMPCVCPRCLKLGFEYEGRGARICKHDESDRGHTANHRDIVSAVEVVKRHSFWEPAR